VTIHAPERLFTKMSRHEPNSPGRSQEDAEDVRLMELVSAGDTAAFETLVERHQRLVVGTVARMLGNNSDAEDIGQQVFVRVWKSAKRYVARAKFTTWLLKITRNLVFNELRRRSRHAQVPLQTEGEEEERPLRDERAVAPDASLLEQELQQAIDTAISRLPETQRMAVILRRYEELSYEEIAETLDQSVSAVKSLLFRARTELRESLKRYLDA
jgi:RNA polymerase sigma-70 factor (ECF subfamily)